MPPEDQLDQILKASNDELLREIGKVLDVEAGLRQVKGEETTP